MRRAVPLKYGPAGVDTTDIDVLGIKFVEPFQAHCVICDCKEKQRAKPYERIFWAKGLADFVRADEAYVALVRAPLEVIHFARGRGGVGSTDAGRAFPPFKFDVIAPNGAIAFSGGGTHDATRIRVKPL